MSANYDKFQVTVKYDGRYGEDLILVQMTRNGFQWYTESVPLSKWPEYMEALKRFTKENKIRTRNGITSIKPIGKATRSLKELP